MHFGFILELSDIDLWNIDLLETRLDLLSPRKYTDIPSKYFVCPHNIFKTFSRHVFKTSLRHLQDMPLRCLQDMSSRRLQGMSSSRLQDVFSVTIFRLARHLQDVFARCLQDVLEDVKLLRWRRAEDVFKTSSRPTNVCWEVQEKISW